MTLSECICESLKPFIPTIELVGGTGRRITTFSEGINVEYTHPVGHPSDKFHIKWEGSKFMVNNLVLDHAEDVGRYIISELVEEEQ